MIDSDPEPGPNTSTDDRLSREEILQQHKPIRTYPRPRRRQVRDVWDVILIAWAFVCGILAGFLLPLIWAGIVLGLLGWLLPKHDLTLWVVMLIPPAALIGWAALRERERDVRLPTKVFLGVAVFTWILFVLQEPWIVS